MSTWTDGYVTDLNYTYGFYREMTPSLLSFAALISGHNGLNTRAPFRYCELGCGHGETLNILASANSSGEFYANDFNPSQIGGARKLAAEAGLSNIHFYDAAFVEFVDEPSLPDSFDVIVLHGIYSWVNAANRAAIVDFISRKLKVGGLVYISYNAMPGWSAAAPMRHLMYLHGKMKGGPTAGRLDPALQFVEQMQSANAAFFRANGSLAERLQKLKSQQRNYLAHEYFNDAWQLFYHSEVVEDLAAAKLTFLGSAAILESVDVINFTPDQLKIVAEVTDFGFRETIKDFMRNQQFRRDIFVKGPNALAPREARDHWLDQRFVLSTVRNLVPLKVTGALGAADLHPDSYNPLLDGLAEGPATVGQLMAEKAVADLGWPRLMQALAVLVGSGHLEPALPAEDEGKRSKTTRAFNAAVMRRAEWSSDHQFLASPVSGGGIQLNRFSQLFLAAVEQGNDPVQHVWDVLAVQGQKIVKDGRTLDSEEENRSELVANFAEFSERRLPALKQLGIAQ